MDINAYLSKHDTKPSPSGAECIRLAGAVGKSPMYLYLVALGHKRLGPRTALELHRNSIGGELLPADIRPDTEWQRDQDGQFIGYVVPVPAKVA